MRVWRVSDHADLSGRGGLLASARWHRSGTPVVYRADHPATALLEKLVHIDLEDMPSGYTLLTIETPDSRTHRILAADLPGDWMSDTAITQAIGTKLLADGLYLMLWVPSVLVPHAWNALLNPAHPDALNCAIIDSMKNLFDPRLIR